MEGKQEITVDMYVQEVLARKIAKLEVENAKLEFLCKKYMQDIEALKDEKDNTYEKKETKTTNNTIQPCK